MTARWLWRWLEIVGLGLLFAIVVTEIELALGFDLLDAPFFHPSPLMAGLAVAALAFAVWQSRPATTTAGVVAGVLAFGIVVLPFSALVERPPTPVDFWRGNAGLLLDRTMTVNRRHAVVLVVRGAEQIPRTPASPGEARDILGADVVVARLYADPRASFTIVPDKDEPKPLGLTGDLRWTWTATPRQQGVQRLVLELDTLAKNRGAADTMTNRYRQLLFVTVQPPSWYEAGRQWLIDLVAGA